MANGRVRWSLEGSTVWSSGCREGRLVGGGSLGTMAVSIGCRAMLLCVPEQNCKEMDEYMFNIAVMTIEERTLNTNRRNPFKPSHQLHCRKPQTKIHIDGSQRVAKPLNTSSN